MKNNHSLIKSILACTAKNDARAVLNFVHVLGVDGGTSTVVATDGYGITIVNIDTAKLDLAVQDDIIVKIENDYGIFYIERKRKNLDCDTPYPDIKKVIPELVYNGVTVENNPRIITDEMNAFFGPELLERATAVLKNLVPYKNVVWVPTHRPLYGDRYSKDFLHALIIPGAFIGLMPIRGSANFTIDGRNFKCGEALKDIFGI